MKPLLSLVALMMLLTCAGCGGDSHESIAAESTSLMKDLVAALEPITDGPTAKAAKPKIVEIVKKMNALKERQAKLGTPTEADLKAMIDKHGAAMEDLQKKMNTVMMRVQFNPAIQAELNDVDFKAMQ